MSCASGSVADKVIRNVIGASSMNLAGTPIFAFEPVQSVGEFRPDEFSELGDGLSPAEKLVIEWKNAEPDLGLGRISGNSVCWWTVDRRRVTLATHQHGHTIRISAFPDPAMMEGGSLA